MNKSYLLLISGRTSKFSKGNVSQELKAENFSISTHWILPMVCVILSINEISQEFLSEKV